MKGQMTSFPGYVKNAGTMYTGIPTDDISKLLTNRFSTNMNDLCDCSFPFKTVSIARTFRIVPTAARMMDIILCYIGSKWSSTFVLFLVEIFRAIAENPSHITIAK